MPIRVQCACGSAFAAKDELAGRTVKCPKCQQPLVIPAAGAAPAAAPQPRQQVPAAAPQRVAAPLPSQAAHAPHPAGDFFAEAGLHAQQAGMVPCPGCANPMPMNALICIKCGYNKKIGRRMETIKGASATEIPGGHSATVEEMLSKAATRIEEDKEEERKKTAEGMPWWVYLIAMAAVIGFMATMMLLPPNVAMATGGVIIYSLALIINLYAVIRILIIAFSEGIGHGIGCLICGLYMLVYCIMRWDRCGTYFLTMVATNVVANILAFSFQFAIQMNKEDEARRLDPAPPAVAQADFDCRPMALRRTATT